MDGDEMILNAPVTPPSLLVNADVGREKLSAVNSADDRKTKQLAKDFESVLMTKLVDAMKDTVNQFDDEQEDGAGGQVKGLFWYYLAQDVADKGGLGLWKDLYRFFSDLQNPAAPAQSLDEGI
jgi:Rod binding domain-containing protein